jgi:HAD superfamily hydrolase (TIGR01509 family)
MPIHRRYFHDGSIDALLRDSDAVVFDMNGLIVDDEPLQLEAYNEVLGADGVAITPQWWTGRCLGRKASQFVREFLEEHGRQSDEFEAILAAKERIYARLLRAGGHSLVRPGVRELLAFLREQPDLQVALATSSHRRSIGPTMESAGIDLGSSFRLVVSGDEVRHGKPDPEIFLKVRDHLPTCRQFLVLEDSPPGVLAAKAAQMRVIAVPNSLTRGCDFSAADAVLSDLTQAARRLT